jgi:phospholipase C
MAIQEVKVEKLIASSLSALLVVGTLPSPAYAASSPETETPIKHLVVIFQENVSFDHYFATYPKALNPAGEPAFTALPSTPAVNGLSGTLLIANPNAINPANGTGATNPFRLDRSQAATADQDHDYGPEQKAFDGGLMDAFPVSVGTPGPPPTGGNPIFATDGLTMGYYDGNTVTAYWNYAQRYAMSDNSYDTNFGPSTDGAVNLISGQLNGVIQDINPGGATIGDGSGGLTLISDADPVGDVCSTTTGERVQFGGQNIGDLLNAAGITWGFFEGGFNLNIVNPNQSTGCSRSSTSTVTNVKKADYIPHHEPFQYYVSTANPAHTRPTSTAMIGYTDRANHQYDIRDFYNALNTGNFPAVSFLKAPGYQDAHAGYSSPLDDQTFVVTVINFLQKQADWKSTAVIIAFDDSDGWYDHQLGQIVNQSATSADALTGVSLCGTGAPALPGIDPLTEHAQGRCGYGPRLPLLVISPYARYNFVDHTMTDQTSILRFIEDNWLDGQRIGAGSFDSIANSIDNMFNFGQGGTSADAYILNPGNGKLEASPTEVVGVK